MPETRELPTSESDLARWEEFSAAMVDAVREFEMAIDSEDAATAVALEKRFEETARRGGVAGLWFLSLLASRTERAGRFLAGHLTETFAREHGTLPTGVLVTLLRDSDEAVRDEAWQAIHNLYEDPGNLRASAEEFDLLAAAAHAS